jgi:hypothetical protein
MRMGLFAEDDGQAALLRPLIERLAADEGVDVQVEERSAVGGVGVTKRALRSYVVDLAAGREPFLEALVVARDGDCRGGTMRREEIARVVGNRYAGRLVVAVPEPHVEIWYLADPRAVARAVGSDVTADVPTLKCERNRYKRALRQAFVGVGITPVAGGVEYGRQIAEGMDLALACRNDSSLARFVADVRGCLRAIGTADA